MSLRIRQPQIKAPVAPDIVAAVPRGISAYDEAKQQGRLWTPVELRGRAKLFLWLDASDLGTIGSSGGNVNTWADKSGRGNIATQSGGNAPDWSVNGWKPVDKNAPCASCTADRMDLSTSTTYNGTNGMSFHCAVRNSGAATYRNLLGTSNGSIEFRVTNVNKLNIVRLFQLDIFATAATVPTGYVLLGFDAATNRSDLWINGTVETSAANGAYSSANGTLFIHAAGGNQWWDSAVAEIVWTDFIMTAAEQARVQGYLAWKWGLEGNLPATHLFKQAPPLIGYSGLRYRMPAGVSAPAGAGAANFAGTATIVFGQSGALAGTSILAGTAAVQFGQTGTLRGGATAAGTTAIVFGQTGALAGTSVLAGSSAIVFGQTGALAGASVLAGTSPVVFGQTGTLKANTVLAGTTPIVFGQTGTLNGGAILAGTTPILFSQTGTFFAGAAAGNAAFQGTIALQFGQTGAITAGTAFTGTAAVQFGQSGAFVAGGAAAVLAGTASVVFGQTGAFAVTSILAGTAPIQFGQTGTFVAGATPGAAVFQGTAAIQFGHTGTFRAAARLTGTAPVQFSQTGTFTAATAGAAAFAGTTPILFGQTGTFRARARFLGTVPIVFGQSGNFVGGIVIVPERGADLIHSGVIAGRIRSSVSGKGMRTSMECR